MSRCFPFPPPGYERKLRIDDDSLLAKEKDKEKKEKKHRRDKDKEKKEGKDKDKERSKDRHRDKDKDKDKEKKEKHKHKDKKKDKSRSRDERGGSSVAEKAGSNSPQSNQFTGISSAQELGQRINHVDVATGNQTVVKINGRDQGRGEPLDKSLFEQKANGQTRLPKVAIVCSNLNGLDQRKAEFGKPMEINRSVEHKQNPMHQRIEKEVKSQEKDGKRFEGHGVQINPPKDNAFVQEFGRRISAENGASGSQVFAKPNFTNQKRNESIGKVANGGNVIANHSFQAKEAPNFGNGGQKVALVQNFKGLEQRGSEMVRTADIGTKISVGGTKRNGFNGIGDMGHKEKKIKINDEDKNIVRTEDKAKQGGDNIIKLSRLAESGSDSIDYSKQHALSVSNKSLKVISAKRKEPEANGFLHDTEMRPSKLQRTVLSPQSRTESGRNLQLSPTITLSASKQGIPYNSFRLDSKEPKVNGIVGAQQSPLVSTKPSYIANARSNGPMTPITHESPLVSSTKLPTTSVKVNGPMIPQESPLVFSTKLPSTSVKVNGPMIPQESPFVFSTKLPSTSVNANGIVPVHESPLVSAKPTSSSKTKHKSKHKDKDKDKSSSKPPSTHPDTKYLSQIFSIPNTLDLSESDDQEWLFNTNSSRSKETKTGSLSDDDMQHRVWSKTVHIESADVHALPYVIPY